MAGIDHPSRDPSYAAAVEKGRLNAHKLKFASEGQRRDYERAIASNPINVYGLPQFAPAIVPKFAVAADIAHAGESARLYLDKSNIVATMLYCLSCDSVTEHNLSSTQGFCTVCGRQSEYRSTPPEYSSLQP